MQTNLKGQKELPVCWGEEEGVRQGGAEGEMTQRHEEFFDGDGNAHFFIVMTFHSGIRMSKLITFHTTRRGHIPNTLCLSRKETRGEETATV